MKSPGKTKSFYNPCLLEKTPRMCMFEHTTLPVCVKNGLRHKKGQMIISNVTMENMTVWKNVMEK